MIDVVGDVMLDVLLLPELRASEQPSGLLLRPGGSAANTACWLRYQGSRVTFAGCVGEDPVGEMLVFDLQQRGVIPHMQRTGQVESGAVAVEVSEVGERTMRSSRGANAYLAPTTIRSMPADGLDWLHVSGYSLLGPYGLEMLLAAGQRARDAGIPLSFDPSSLGVISHFGPGRVLDAARQAGVRLLLPNQEEAQALVEAPDVATAAHELSAWIPLLAISCGREGAWWSDGAAEGPVPTAPLLPLDTTGAGDAFDAGVIQGCLNGLGLREACSLGNHLAAQVIQQWGGRPPN